jgi:hypothetical protein
MRLFPAEVVDSFNYILLLPYNKGLFIGEYAMVVETRYISTLGDIGSEVYLFKMAWELLCLCRECRGKINRILLLAPLERSQIALLYTATMCFSRTRVLYEPNLPVDSFSLSFITSRSNMY